MEDKILNVIWLLGKVAITVFLVAFSAYTIFGDVMLLMFPEGAIEFTTGFIGLMVGWNLIVLGITGFVLWRLWFRKTS